MWTSFAGIFFLLPALWVRSAWSGEGFSSAKPCMALVYNVVHIYVHMQFARDLVLPFLGAIDGVVPLWLTFILVIGHGCSIPSEDGVKYLKLGVKKQKNILTEGIGKPRSPPLLDKPLHLAKNVVLILCCSVSTTVFLIAGLSYVLPLSVTAVRTIGVILLAFSIGFGTLWARSERKKS